MRFCGDMFRERLLNSAILCLTINPKLFSSQISENRRYENGEKERPFLPCPSPERLVKDKLTRKVDHLLQYNDVAVKNTFRCVLRD